MAHRCSSLFLFLIIFFLFSLCSSSSLDLPKYNVKIETKKKIVKALHDADFKLMSRVFNGYLSDLLENLSCPGKQLEITIFAPQDEAVDSQSYLYYYRQGVMSKFYKHDFERYSDFNNSITDDRPPMFTSCNLQADRLVVTNVSKTSSGDLHVFINNTRITKWNIYNDSHVIVHGVDNFFGEIQRYIYHQFSIGAFGIKI